MPGLRAPGFESRTEPLFDFGEPRPTPASPGKGGDDLRREPTIGSGAGPAVFRERERPLGSQRRAGPFGPVGSLILHLLPLLLLIDRPMRPPAEFTPIPVQLVMLPPPQPPAEKPRAKPPPGRRASEDLGDTKTEEQKPASNEPPPRPHASPPAAVASPKPAPQKTAAVIPPPSAKTAAAPIKLPAPEPPRPKPKPTPVRHQPVRRAVAQTRFVHHARYPGPAATRSQYLAYLAALTKEHIDLLPPQVIGVRQGETVIALVLHDDGRIASMQIERSSGYPEIDRRIEGMIRAVGKFPPIPQWFQGASLPLQFRMRFPWTSEP